MIGLDPDLELVIPATTPLTLDAIRLAQRTHSTPLATVVVAPHRVGEATNLLRGTGIETVARITRRGNPATTLDASDVVRVARRSIAAGADAVEVGWRALAASVAQLGESVPVGCDLATLSGPDRLAVALLALERGATSMRCALSELAELEPLVTAPGPLPLLKVDIGLTEPDRAVEQLAGLDARLRVRLAVEVGEVLPADFHR